MGAMRIGAALAAAVAFLALGACGGDGDGGGDGSTIDMRLHGVVNALPEASGGEVTPLSGAKVRASVDRNGDGRFAADENVTVNTDDDGKYTLTIPVEKGDVVVIRYAADDMAPIFRTVHAGPRADVLMNVGLRSLERLALEENGRFQVESRDLSIAQLDSGLTGSARAFNPVVDAASFPGGFGDSEGNLLISGVFSVVELSNGEGEVDTLDEPAELRMKLPLDTWNIVVDILPGNDRIDVPMYAFDEVIGTWVRDGEGYLEDANGRILAESELPSVRDGSFAGVIYATAVVRHFSYWNVDWPVESYGCLSGRLLLDSGAPAEGATLFVTGVSYTGSSTPVTVGPDGRFCINAMRSETATDDVDQDGIPGETHTVRFRVAHGGKLYDVGDHDMPGEQASCEEGGCQDLGDIELEPSRVLQAGICSISGRALLREGSPAVGAMVWAFDETLPDEVYVGLCGEYYELCGYFAMADEEGRFTISTPVMDGALVSAWVTGADEEAQYTRWGERRTNGCPAAPIELRLDRGLDVYELEVFIDGHDIEWSPNIPVMWIMVDDDAADSKWYAMADENSSGRTGPLTYGELPAGWYQGFPYDGSAPAPLESGDVITVFGVGVTDDGYDWWASGEYILP